MSISRPGRLVALSITFAFLAGCTSDPVMIAPRPPKQYTRLGPASGEACGSLGFVLSSLYFVPMGLNGRVEQAYANAVASVPGATGLVDVTLEENWGWYVLVTGRCTTIKGVAIK